MALLAVNILNNKIKINMTKEQLDKSVRVVLEATSKQFFQFKNENYKDLKSSLKTSKTDGFE
jgi:hypothetical protein